MQHYTRHTRVKRTLGWGGGSGQPHHAALASQSFVPRPWHADRLRAQGLQKCGLLQPTAPQPCVQTTLSGAHHDEPRGDGFFFLLLFLTDTELWRASQRSNADPKYLGVRRRRRELRDGWAEVYIAEPGGLPAAAAAAAGVQVQYLLDNRRGGPAEAGGKRWKPTACRFVKNLTE